MDIEVKEERDNKMMERKEVELDIDHSGEATPSRASVQGAAAKVLGEDPEFTEVKQIRSGVGRASSRARVYVWEDREVGLYSEEESDEEESEQPEEEAPEQEEQESQEEAEEEASEEAEEPEEEPEETAEESPEEEADEEPEPEAEGDS